MPTSNPPTEPDFDPDSIPVSRWLIAVYGTLTGVALYLLSGVLTIVARRGAAIPTSVLISVAAAGAGLFVASLAYCGWLMHRAEQNAAGR
jgi:hypothetical protein